MDKLKRTELKVGIFIILGLIILAMLIISFGFKSSELSKTYPLTVQFNYTSGVVVGAPVRYAGVDSGIVKGIELDQIHNHVLLNLLIHEQVKIRQDCRVIINSLGIIGEKYVEFIPQSITAEYIKPGEILIGEDPMALGDMMEQGLKFVENLETKVNLIFSDQLIEDIHSILNQIKQLSGPETKKKIDQILINIEQLVDPKLKDELIQTIDQVKGLLSEGHLWVENLNQLTEAELKDLVQVAKSFFQRFDKVTQQLSVTMQSIEKQEGTIGKLIYDESLHENIELFIKNFDALVVQLRTKGLLYKPDNKKSSVKERRR